MKKLAILNLLLSIFIVSQVSAQKPDKAALLKGVNFIDTRTYSAEDDAKILDLYKNLRVADVSDGLDMAGLPGTGLVIPEIHSCWVDLRILNMFSGHCCHRPLCTDATSSSSCLRGGFSKWEGNFYSTYSHEAFSQILRPGSAVVIDDVEDRDIGSIGRITYSDGTGQAQLVW